MWVSISLLDAVGAVAAAAALLIGRIGANMYLAPAMRVKVNPQTGGAMKL
jgi:hypothetical protein